MPMGGAYTAQLYLVEYFPTFSFQRPTLRSDTQAAITRAAKKPNGVPGVGVT